MYNISDCVSGRQIPGTMEPPGIPKATMGRLAIATPPIWPGSSEATPPGRITNY